MATFYSDHFSATGISATTRDPLKHPDTGLLNARVFSAIATATALATTSDVLRMISLPSSARILEMFTSAGDEAAAGAYNIGIYKSEGLGGDAIDADLFASAVAKNAARVDALIEATTITKMMRGQYLWQMAHTGDGTFTKDPAEIWDICITPSTTFTTTANTFHLEVKYMLGS